MICFYRSLGHGKSHNAMPRPKIEECLVFQDSYNYIKQEEGKNTMKCMELSKLPEEDSTNWIEIFRGNVLEEMEKQNLSMKELAKKSDLPISTIGAFLYGQVRDMRVSTAIRLSKSMGVYLDRLIGANTLSEHQSKLIQNYDKLTETGKCFISWYSEHLTIKQNSRSDRQTVCVMHMKLKNDYIVMTRDCEQIELPFNYNGKIYFGFTLPCDYYMPNYCKNEIILMANDRKPYFDEHCLIRLGDAIYFARRKIVGNTAQYFSIRDGKYRVDEKNIDELIGYVVDAIDFSQIHDMV